MKTLIRIINRNVKLFFKDKGMFFSALITPMILLVLYATFLAKVYRESFVVALPEGFSIPDQLIDGTVVSQLISALLAVSCITVSFCSNLLMIQDKANGVFRDFTVSPVRRAYLGTGYYVASSFATLIIAFSALSVCLIYLSTQGWYLTVSDVIHVILDVFLLTLFGTALSSCVNFFLKTNGQASAVGTVISAGYGFICGAYMPISTFSEGLRNVIMFLPGTYGTALLKNDMMRGVFAEMEKAGIPPQAVEGIRDSVDCRLYFFDNLVPEWVNLVVIAAAVLFFTGLFVVFHVITKRSKAK
ncbi:MAG: ABC transporter permease [Clostridia bacterium]|nr:ABC transporter permease [Clostridia bacterium]